MTAYRFRRAAPTLLLVAAAAAFPATPANAAPGDEFRWTVQPSAADGAGDRSQFSYDLAPGRQLDDHVTIRNLSRAPLTFSVYPADAFTTTDGAFAMPAAGAAARAAGSWVKLAPGRHTVKPGARIVLPVRIAVPRNATPGDHAAGIIASVTVPGKNAAGKQVLIDRRVAARVYLRVDGALAPRARVESTAVSFGNPLAPFRRGTMTVTYTVHNTGNVRLGGTAEVRARGLFGAKLSATTTRDLPEILPGSAVTFTDRVEGVLPAGKITAAVEVTTTTGTANLPVESGSAVTWQPPWTLVYLLAVGAISAVLLLRRRRAGSTSRPQPLEAGTAPA